MFKYCLKGTGYQGNTCEEKVSYCNHGNCLNGGQCIEMETGFSCNCTEGKYFVVVSQKWGDTIQYNKKYISELRVVFRILEINAFCTFSWWQYLTFIFRFYFGKPTHKICWVKLNDQNIHTKWSDAVGQYLTL